MLKHVIELNTKHRKPTHSNNMANVGEKLAVAGSCKFLQVVVAAEEF